MNLADMKRRIAAAERAATPVFNLADALRDARERPTQRSFGRFPDLDRAWLRAATEDVL